MNEAVEEPKLEGQLQPEMETSIHELGKLCDWDGDDTMSEAGKSTTSSNYPFGSPNPSDLDDHGNISESADKRRRRKGEGSAHRPAYPMSERQQMALLKQITRPADIGAGKKNPFFLRQVDIVIYCDLTSPTEKFKRVHDSIKPPVWSTEELSHLFESSLAGRL